MTTVVEMLFASYNRMGRCGDPTRPRLRAGCSCPRASRRQLTYAVAATLQIP